MPCPTASCATVVRHVAIIAMAITVNTLLRAALAAIFPLVGKLRPLESMVANTVASTTKTSHKGDAESCVALKEMADGAYGNAGQRLGYPAGRPFKELQGSAAAHPAAHHRRAAVLSGARPAHRDAGIQESAPPPPTGSITQSTSLGSVRCPPPREVSRHHEITYPIWAPMDLYKPDFETWADDAIAKAKASK